MDDVGHEDVMDPGVFRRREGDLKVSKDTDDDTLGDDGCTAADEETSERGDQSSQ